MIELMIVIGIIGILAAVFLPDLLGAKESANVTATAANLSRLATGAETFARRHGYYPPDDLQDPEDKLKFKPDNGLNTGIESLVAFLSQSRADGADLGDLGSALTNTDGDDHGELLPVLNRKGRLEVADAWGTPLAYFSKQSKALGFGRPQTVASATGERLVANARKNADGLFLGNGKFQLLSAGRDLAFGTDDDVSWPDR
jgi:type II secretory pathway pseudopilin PulG